MDLTVNEVESLISQIVLGRAVMSIKRSSGEEELLAFVFPSREVQQNAEVHKKRAIEFGRSIGLPTVEAMEKLLIKRGFWGDEKEAELKTLKASLHAQEMVLSKTTKVKLRRTGVIDNIEKIKSKIFDLRRSKEAFLEHTIDRRAEEERLLFLTWSCTYKPDAPERFWGTLEKFKAETDVIFRRGVSLEFSFFLSGLPMKTIRYIARSTSWVIKYLAAQKHGGSLFKSEVYDYSVDMAHLMYWTTFYQSLNEMLPEDRPDEVIIDNDEALDKYMDEYFKRQRREASDARIRKGAGKKSSAWDHEELIVTKSNPLYEDIEFTKSKAQKLRERGDTSTVELVEKK